MTRLVDQPTERLVGFAQVAITAIFLGGFFAVFMCILLGYIRTPVEYKDALIALLGVITGSIGTIVTFWFSRSRPQGQA